MKKTDKARQQALLREANRLLDRIEMNLEYIFDTIESNRVLKKAA